MMYWVGDMQWCVRFAYFKVYVVPKEVHFKEWLFKSLKYDEDDSFFLHDMELEK